MQQADFADLDAFTAVANAHGFRAAATLRNVSASSLSEAVRRLEARLGVRLLNRTTRSVTPTEAGQKLLERLSPALADVALALDEVNAFRDSPTGTLRLNVPLVVSKVVMPRLIPKFLALNPGVAVEIIAEDSFIDVLALSRRTNAQSRLAPQPIAGSAAEMSRPLNIGLRARYASGEG